MGAILVLLVATLPQLGVSRYNVMQGPQSIIGLPNPSAAFCDHIIWLGLGLRQSVRLVWAPRPCEDKVCLQMIIFAHMKTVILYYYSSCT